MKNRQFRVFNKVWEEQCFFKDVESITVCLIYDDSLHIKVYNLKHCFTSKHAEFCAELYLHVEAKTKNLFRIKK